MKKWILWMLCAIALLSFCLPVSVSAAAIEPEKDASLTLVYKHEGVVFEGLEIRTYRVADVKDDFVISLAGDFADYPVKVYGITSQAEWNITYQTLEAYIWADGLKPTATAVTDAEGIVQFKGLTPGMYLTMPVTHLDESSVTDFFGFLTVIPNPEDDGSLNYDVTAYPKSSSFTPEDGDSIPMRVVKQWKDSGYQEYRPESVQVDIYRNGEYKTSVSLSAENNWSYDWIVPDDGAVWTAVERDVPPKYSVTIETKDNTIILTNVREGDVPPPPTGDTTVLWPFILVMCISGCLVILFAMKTKKAQA